VFAQWVGLAAGHAVGWAPEHVCTHAPPEQSVPAAQAVPHAPQFAGSASRSVQNAASPEPHASGRAVGQPHVPPEHCWPAGQTAPHAPQFSRSRATTVQVPPHWTEPPRHSAAADVAFPLHPIANDEARTSAATSERICVWDMVDPRGAAVIY
jgi:hypothetical protein